MFGGVQIGQLSPSWFILISGDCFWKAAQWCLWPEGQKLPHGSLRYSASRERALVLGAAPSSQHGPHASWGGGLPQDGLTPALPCP